jgi:hypothetical protein
MDSTDMLIRKAIAMRNRVIFLWWIAIAAGILFCAGCGQIIDKDRIRVAKMDEEYITRGDLYELIRNMSDDERPAIRSRGDYLRVLNQYIDRKIKRPLGKKLHEEEKIDVPRAVAREAFFAKKGEEGEYLRSVYAMEIPEGGQQTPLMKTYNLTAAGMRAMKEAIEDETDRMLRDMLGDEAVSWLALQDFKEGKITIEPERIEREYRLRSDQFRRYESIRFIAFRYPADMQASLTMAARLREEIDEGRGFDELVNEALNRNANLVIESEIENNPARDRFRGFWTAASGAAEGAIIGPVYLPEYRQVTQDAQGRTKEVTMPDAWLVLKVLERKPESTLSMEEAKPLILPGLIISEKIQQLRAGHGVEIYEEKLPNPIQYDEDPVFE